MVISRGWQRLLAALGLRLVVRVRAGIAEGARWTAYPWSAYWRGGHEPVVQRVLTRLAEQGRGTWTCWDLGAHYGLYSVGLARRLGPGAKVIALEPNPLSFARLERHKAMNGLTNLDLYRSAASDETGQGLLFTYGQLESTTTHLRYEGEEGVGGQPISVGTVRLDDWVRDGRIPLPNFIKVDVEGHAHRALAGAAESLARMRPFLFVAFHSPEEERGTEAILGPLGYVRELVCGRDYLYRPDRAGVTSASART